MHVSVSTSTFYYRPFNESLEIIAESDFKFIELAVYWKSETWEIAQHLRDLPAKDVVRLIEDNNLQISTIHDTAGVAKTKFSSPSEVISPHLENILKELPEPLNCLVFHTPHLIGAKNTQWWASFSQAYAQYLESFRENDIILTIETMPTFEGYYVPLVTPEDYKSFVLSNNLGITLDTTHFAQIGIDITKAAQILGNKVRTIHLSDFIDGKSHTFLGDGNLNWDAFFRELDYSELYSITLECSMSSNIKEAVEMTKKELITRLREAKSRLDELLRKYYQ